MTYPLSEGEAVTVAIVMIEAFESLSVRHLMQQDPEIVRGIMLLFTQIMERVSPLIPDRPEMVELKQVIKTAGKTSALIRKSADLPGHQ